MKATGWLVAAGACLVAVTLAGCRMTSTPRRQLAPPPFPGPKPAALDVPLGEGQTLGEPIVHANLAVYPVRSSVQAEVVDYLTLDEALKKGLIEVTEKDEAEVNEVYVTSRADLPVYLMAGEVILGGKQDRVVAKDTIVPAHAKKHPVPVFCVEPHRWVGDSTAFRDSNLQASLAVRRAAQATESQERVWAEVARANAQAGVAPASGTYRAGAEESGGAKAARKYVDAIAPTLRGDQQAVGMVVAIDGKVVGADVYASQTLFRKLQGKLLAAHARDAVLGARPGRPAAAPPPAKEAERFLQEARQGTAVRQEVRGQAKMMQVQSRSTMGFQTTAPVPGGAAKAAPLHENYYQEGGR